jgi:hypothetical protein
MTMQDNSILLPPGAVTGIGSLPFRDPHIAVQFVEQACPLVPFWPELPQRSPDARSVEQTLSAFADLVRPRCNGSGYEVLPSRLATLLERLEQAPAHLEPARSAGFFAFAQAVAAGRFAHAIAVKGQLIGPLTLAWQLFAEGVPLVAQPVYRAAIGRYLRRLAHWQIDRLTQSGKPVLFFLDEPCLALVPSPSEISHDELVTVLHDLLAALRRPGVLLGVHTCARLPCGSLAIAALCQARPEIISFDAHQGLEAFCADPAAQDFLRSGGRVAFGLVPTWQRLDHPDPNVLFERWLDAVRSVMAVDAVARQTLITATCGLGLLPASAAASSFHLAHQLVQRIAQVAQATA